MIVEMRAPMMAAVVVVLSLCAESGVLRTLELSEAPVNVTRQIQDAIDETSCLGGGTIQIPPGNYLACGIFLKNDVTLRLAKGAVLNASTNLSDYVSFDRVLPPGFEGGIGLDQETSCRSGATRLTAVIGAVCATNVALEGEGLVHGHGSVWRERTRDANRWRNVLFYRCSNVRVEGVSLRDAAKWNCYFKECENVAVRRVNIRSQAYWENDGIDIEAKNAIVEDCDIDTLDDAICLKNDNPDFTVENIEVRNCRIASCCNFIKFGTTCYGGYRNCSIHDCKLLPCRESPLYHHNEIVMREDGTRGPRYPGVTEDVSGVGGISIESPDGGRISDIHIWNIDMTAPCVQTPIFIRLQRRAVRSDGGHGSLENILIENVKGVALSRIASSITGVPGLRVRNVTIRNVDLTVKGGGTAVASSIEVPEYEDHYPTPQMFDYMMLPAYAFYLRHADGIRFENVHVRYASSREERKPVVQEDCSGVEFANCSFAEPTPAKEGIEWHDGTELVAKGMLEGRAFEGVSSPYDRLPADSTNRVPAGVSGARFHTCGECFRFKTSSSRIWVRWSLAGDLYAYHMAPTGRNGIDLYAWDESRGWRYRQWRPLGARKIAEKDNLTSVEVVPGTPLMIYLPLYNGPSKIEFGFEKGSTVEKLPPRKSGIGKPVVFYGTSITHGACASRPGMAFPAIVCRRIDAPLVDLGFSGNGRMDTGMIDYLSQIDASCYVLDCLWNMPNHMVEDRFEPFVRELARRRPETPIVVSLQYDVYGEGRFTVKDRLVRQVCAKLDAEGVRNLILLPLEGMYDPDGDGTVDGTHPNDWGMICLAQAFEKGVRQALRLPPESNGSADTVEPVRVIFDTDMYTDFDDAGALACLHALADAGECEILATLANTRDCMSVAMCEIINAYYGRPDIPVGCVKGMGLMNERAEAHARRYGATVKKYAKWVRHANSSDAPDAAEVYRKVLSAQPDKSVVICSVGFMTNMRKLVEMDRDLVARKVKRWVAMACNYPNGREYNSMKDWESSKIAFEKWPTPIVFTDFQYGMDCFAGRALAESDVKDSPIADVFRGNIPSRESIAEDAGKHLRSSNGMPGRSAWDETAVLIAVRGIDRYFNVRRGTYRMVGDTGENEWVPDEENGPHLRVTEKVDKLEVGRVIDELICRGVRKEKGGNL